MTTTARSRAGAWIRALGWAALLLAGAGPLPAQTRATPAPPQPSPGRPPDGLLDDSALRALVGAHIERDAAPLVAALDDSDPAVRGPAAALESHCARRIAGAEEAIWRAPPSSPRSWNGVRNLLAELARRWGRGAVEKVLARHRAAASRLLDEKVVRDVEANEEMCERHAEATLATATALNPHIGYDLASEIVKEAASSGRSLREVAREKGVDEAILDEALDYRTMARPHG